MKLMPEDAYAPVRAPFVCAEGEVQEVRQIHYFPDGTMSGIVNRKGKFFSIFDIREEAKLNKENPERAKEIMAKFKRERFL